MKDIHNKYKAPALRDCQQEYFQAHWYKAKMMNKTNISIQLNAFIKTFFPFQ